MQYAVYSYCEEKRWKGKVFMTVGEEGRKVNSMYTDQEREIHQGC